MMKKKILIAAVVWWSLAMATPSAASPLYAGYNGQSRLLIDTLDFGVDFHVRWWVRVPVDLLPGSVRIIFKYESTGAVSTEVVLFGITGQGDLLFGFDTSGQTWGESYRTGFVNGFDSTGATWTEQDVLQFVGSGSDNANNTWLFVTFLFRNALPFSAGANISLLAPETPSEEPALSKGGDGQLSPAGAPSTENILKLTGYLMELSRSGELQHHLARLMNSPLDQEALLTFAEEELFSPGRREALSRMIMDN